MDLLDDAGREGERVLPTIPRLRRWGAGLLAAVVALPLSSAPLPSMLPSTLSGRVTDAVSMAPVAAAKIRARGGSRTRTDSDGLYTLALAGGLTTRLLLRHPDFYPRRAWTSTGEGPAAFDSSLIPRDGGFDLEFFDHVFRGLGRRGTDRWIDSTMNVEIWTRAFELDPGLRRYVERGDASAQFIAAARSVVEQHVGELTGGVVRPGRVRLVTHPFGTSLSSDEMQPAGVVRIAVATDPTRPDFSLVSVSCAAGPGTCSGTIDVHPNDMDRRAIVLHELGHVLGWDHPLDRDRVPLPSLMGPRPEPDFPTEHDLLHGPILYSRPVGSRSPDRDPRPAGRVARAPGPALSSDARGPRNRASRATGRYWLAERSSR